MGCSKLHFGQISRLPSLGLTRGHVAFDTSSFFRKIAVCLDSPYLQQIASKRKMPKNAIACRTSIPRSKRANYQLIEQLNFVQNRIFEKKKGTRSRISVLKLYTHSVNLYTHSVKLYTHRVCVHSTGAQKYRYRSGFSYHNDEDPSTTPMNYSIMKQY